jgi:hypothetical protein
MGDCVAKSRVRGESPAAQPQRRSSFAAPVRALGPRGVPAADQTLVCLLGLFAATPLPLADRGQVVRVSRAPLATAGRMPGTEFEVTDLLGVQRRTDPGIVFLAPQQMPDDHRQLARGRDGSDVLATTRADPQEEGAQRPRRPCRRPGGLNQHATSMATALFGDPAVVDRSWSRLPDARVQAEVTDQVPRSRETPDVADRGQHPERDHHVDARNRHQPLAVLISQGVAREVALDHAQIIAQVIIRPHLPLDRKTLILG